MTEICIYDSNKKKLYSDKLNKLERHDYISLQIAFIYYYNFSFNELNSAFEKDGKDLVMKYSCEYLNLGFYSIHIKDEKSVIIHEQVLPNYLTYADLTDFLKKIKILEYEYQLNYFTDLNFTSKIRNDEQYIDSKTPNIYCKKEEVIVPEEGEKYFYKLKNGKIARGYNFKENIDVIKYKNETLEVNNLIGPGKLFNNLNNFINTDTERYYLQQTLGVIYDIIFINENYLIYKDADSITKILNKYKSLNLDKYFCIVNYEKRHLYPIFINFKKSKIFVLDAFRPETEILNEYSIEINNYYYYFDYKDKIPNNEKLLIGFYKYKLAIRNDIKEGNINSDIKKMFAQLNLYKIGCNYNIFKKGITEDIEVDEFEIKIKNGNDFQIYSNSELIFDTSNIDLKLFDKIFQDNKNFFDNYKYIEFMEIVFSKDNPYFNLRSAKNFLVMIIIQHLDINNEDYYYFSSETKIQSNSQTCGIISAYIISIFKEKLDKDTDPKKIVKDIENDVLSLETILKDKENQQNNIMGYIKQIFNSNDENIKKILFSDKL